MFPLVCLESKVARYLPSTNSSPLLHPSMNLIKPESINANMYSRASEVLHLSVVQKQTRIILNRRWQQSLQCVSLLLLQLVPGQKLTLSFINPALLCYSSCCYRLMLFSFVPRCGRPFDVLFISWYLVPKPRVKDTTVILLGGSWELDNSISPRNY